MTTDDLDEAVSIVATIAAALGTTVQGNATGVSDLRRAIGVLTANAEDLILSASLGEPLADCFNKARLAGATMDGLARVRSVASSASPAGAAAIEIAIAAVRLALVQEAQIVSALTFESRDDVDRFLGRLNTAFDVAAVAAADALETGTYRAIVTLHAAVSNDLTTRSRPLPRLVSYSFKTTIPALWLANRLYGEGDRATELIAENRPVHPAFMPPAGRALSQ